MPKGRRSLNVKYLGHFGSQENGFTLIELMVALLILSILVAIAVPVFLNGKANSDRKIAMANLRIGISCHNGILLEIFDNRPDAQETYRDYDPPEPLTTTLFYQANEYVPVDAQYMSNLEPRITWADIVVDIPVVPVGPVVGGDGGMAFAASNLTYAADDASLLAGDPSEPRFRLMQLYKNGKSTLPDGITDGSDLYYEWNLLPGKIGVVESFYWADDGTEMWLPNIGNERVTMLTLERSGVAHFVTFKLGAIVDSGSFEWDDGNGDPGDAVADDPVVPPVVPSSAPQVVPPVVPPVVILDTEIYLEITPVILRLSSDNFFMAHLNLPSGYGNDDIVLGSVHCNGAYATSVNGSANIKMERQSLLNVSPGDNVVLTITGSFTDGTPFIGTDAVQIRD